MLPAIDYALQKLGLTYKKRLGVPPSKTGPTSRGRAGAGGGGRPAWIPHGSSSLMKRGRKRT